MPAGINALESIVSRLKHKLPVKNTKESIVYTDKDGNMILDPEKKYTRGVLAVPEPMTESEWTNS